MMKRLIVMWMFLINMGLGQALTCPSGTVQAGAGTDEGFGFNFADNEAAALSLAKAEALSTAVDELVNSKYVCESIGGQFDWAWRTPIYSDPTCGDMGQNNWYCDIYAYANWICCY